MAFFRFSSGRAGTSGANIRYITRETATNGDEKNMVFHNYPEYAQEGGNYNEQRNNLIEYCDQEEQDELNRPRRGGGETRTHYRAIGSFENKVETEQARRMAEDYMKENFKGERAIAVVHQDTSNTHVHFHVQARNIEGKKARFDNTRFKSLDSEWNKLYGREFGEEKSREHERKKAETKEYKAAKARGEDIKVPERKNYKSSEIYKNREDRNYGKYELDQAAVRGTDRSSSNGTTERAGNEGSSRRGEQEVNRFIESSKRANQQIERTEQTARGALRESQNLRDTGKERNHSERRR